MFSKAVAQVLLWVILAMAWSCTSDNGSAGGQDDSESAGDAGSDRDTGGDDDGGGDSDSGTGGDGDVDSGTGDTDDSRWPDGQARFFVSTDGSDDNPGTKREPFGTIHGARNAVRAINRDMIGDIHVYLHGGDHRLDQTISFRQQDSGTNGFRIHYLAYPGETPVLHGSEKVTGWTHHNGGIYSATLNRAGKLRNLYVNDRRALMTARTVTSLGGYGLYEVTAGQADWAWRNGSGSDGSRYRMQDVPAITLNRDDLEIINGTTWNENIVTVRDVITSDNARVLLFAQPYGVIAQLPAWDAGFNVSGTHTIVNAYEFLDEPGRFYFDKSNQTLFYYPREDEDMMSADFEAPFVVTLLDIAGNSITERVRNLTFSGITFAHTDYNLFDVAGSYGKATVQGSTIYRAYGDGNWHNQKYEIIDTPPGMITINSADSIEFSGNVLKHSGSEGISMINDVVNSRILGNYIFDIAGSGITIGHPQHVYLGDGGTYALFSPGIEGICTDISISNNVIHDVSSVPGFGGHSGIMTFFTDRLTVTRNFIHTTAYNGISIGWGWRNFKDSNTMKDAVVHNNRLFNTMHRLHDSGAIYTIGQMPGTSITENYVKGIPSAQFGPTYGLHNDEGTAYIVETDNVLDIDPNVTYTINCEDFGEKHNLTILRTYATVSRMGVNPPDSIIEPPIVVSDNIWPLDAYRICVNSGIEDEYSHMLIRSGLTSVADHVFPASCGVSSGTVELPIRRSGISANTVWFAPEGTVNFVQGDSMTRATGDVTSILIPVQPGLYRLFVVDATGQIEDVSEAQLRVN